MRFLVYADLQATDGDEVCYADPTVPLQLYRIQKFFADAARIYKHYRCDGLIDLGDTTDDRSAVPMPVIDAIGEGLDLFPDGRHFKLTGNHEHFLRNASISNRHLFRHKFEVVDEIRTWSLRECDLTFVSFPGENAAMLEFLRSNKPEQPTILFGHFQVEGCQLGNGIASEGVSKNLLLRYSLCLLGHIHIPHALTKTIHYVGSPFQQNWGEAGQIKRVAILDTTPEIKISWVRLQGYPEYRQVSLAEFSAQADQPGEHRFKVTLRNHAEAEQFFANPLFSRGEPVYTYDLIDPQAGTAQEDWTFEGTCLRYLQQVSPASAGITLKESDMLEIGLDIAQDRI